MSSVYYNSIYIFFTMFLNLFPVCVLKDTLSSVVLVKSGKQLNRICTSRGQ